MIEKFNDQIPFHKAYIKQEEIDEVTKTLKSGWLTMGPQTLEFEKQFSAFCGAKHAVAVNSCTAALHLSLAAIGLKEGDEVIIPDMTFTATGEVVSYFKAKTVIIDVSEKDLLITPKAVEKAISPRTKAIIPVHYAGQSCDMDALKEICDKNNLYLIEDAAHALPASYKNKKIGSIGDMTCFSFYATKTLTTGEGGMICTNNDEWAEKMRVLRLHGISKDAWKRYDKGTAWFYEVVDAGFKYNMTDIQAAMGLVQLKRVEWMRNQRQRIAELYSSLFATVDEIDVLTTYPEREHAWHLFVILLDIDKLKISRDDFIRKLYEKGINTSVHFIPLHFHPYYKKTLHLKNEQFPISTNLFHRIISLPIYPDLNNEQVKKIAEIIKTVINQVKNHIT